MLKPPHRSLDPRPRKSPGAAASTRLWLALLFCLLAAAPALATVEIRAGLEQNPPLSFINAQGKPAGILVDILNHVGQQEGWRISYLPDTFENCLQKLRDGRIDLMVTIAYSKERAELYDFNRVNVVGLWGQLYAAPVSSIQSYFDLQDKTVAVVRQDIHQQAFRSLLEKFGISATFLPVENFDAVFSAIHDRKAAAGVVGRFFALRNEEKYGVQPTPLIFNPIEVHYATRRGSNEALLAAIDRHLELLKADHGSPYYQSLDRWLGVLSKRSFPRWLKMTLLGGGAVVLLLFSFIVLLRRQVGNRTRHLEQAVNERIRVERALYESERQYRELVESANAIILRWTTDGRIIFLNEFAESFFGFAKEEVLGRSVIGTIVPEIESSGRDLQAMIEGITHHPEAYLSNENENIRKDGERVWVSWRNCPVHGEAGELVGILSVGLDATDRKRAEQALRDFDRAKDEFISTAAHELRTPLTSIIGYAELLRDAQQHGGFSPEQAGDFLAEINAKGEVLARIIDDLLDISRIQQGIPLPLEKTPGSVAELVEQVVRHFGTVNRRHHLRIEGDSALPEELDFDRHRIGQVLENLLSNAAKYSPDGSEIAIILSPAGDEVRIAVHDCGIGMTPEQVGKVFDRFYRANSTNTAVGGLGLGMSIVRQLVESHGGRIWIESTLGVGTSVTFTLPC